MPAINPEIFEGGFSADSAITTDTAAKILSFADFPVGWHYGEGAPIERQIIDTALDIFWRLSMLGFDETNAFPGIYGEVMVTAYRGAHYVELIAEADGSVSVLYERNDEEIYNEEHLEFSRALELLQKISEEIRAGETWSTSDFYTQTILTPTPIRIASRAWLSGTQVVAYPLSSGTALITGAATFASMPDTFTPITSQGSHLYSGNLIDRYYRQEAS